MTPQEEQKFSALREMFNSKGWEYYLNDIEENIQYLRNTAVASCPDNDSWQQRRGAVSKLEEVQNYQAMMEAIEAQAEEEEDASV